MKLDGCPYWSWRFAKLVQLRGISRWSLFVWEINGNNYLFIYLCEFLSFSCLYCNIWVEFLRSFQILDSEQFFEQTCLQPTLDLSERNYNDRTQLSWKHSKLSQDFWENTNTKSFLWFADPIQPIHTISVVVWNRIWFIKIQICAPPFQNQKRRAKSKEMRKAAE